MAIPTPFPLRIQRFSIGLTKNQIVCCLFMAPSEFGRLSVSDTANYVPYMKPISPLFMILFANYERGSCDIKFAGIHIIYVYVSDETSIIFF